MRLNWSGLNEGERERYKPYYQLSMASLKYGSQGIGTDLATCGAFPPESNTANQPDIVTQGHNEEFWHSGLWHCLPSTPP